jgi:DNA-binding CsgD family transcriptional regulator
MKFISDQEIEVMVRLARGLSPDEIAKDLSISRRTLDWHLSNLFRKTGQHNIRSLFQFAVTYGFM